MTTDQIGTIKGVINFAKGAQVLSDHDGHTVLGTIITELTRLLNEIAEESKK